MPRTDIDYSKGLIYKLVCVNSEIKDIYIGSTTKFVKRKAEHKSVCNNTNDKNHNIYVYDFIRNNGGWENWRMELIDYFPCKTNLELRKREGEYMRSCGSTLNVKKEGRTQKEWRDDNKEKIAEKKKEWRENNKERIVGKEKEYSEKNRENKVEYLKQYYEKNRDKYAEYAKEKIQCECGLIICRGYKSQHIKSQKHLEFINN
jgi:hypothetical protein